MYTRLRGASSEKVRLVSWEELMRSTTKARLGIKARLEIAAALLLMLSLSTAEAHPNLGVPCSACHTQSTGKLTISGNDTAVALTDRLDGVSPELLKVFTVSPGRTANLTINVIDGALVYDPVIYNLDGPGVQNDLSNRLAFTKDPTWEGDFSDHALPYFAFKPAGIAWTTPTSYTYHLNVLPGTPLDYYSVVLGVSGNSSTGRWTQAEEVFVHVTQVPEPAMLAFLGMGLAALCVAAWKSARSSRVTPHT